MPVRHAESAWNKENLFTGWTEVDFSVLGRQERRAAGEWQDTVRRVLPLWQRLLVPDLQSGRRPSIVAHGNTLRALIEYPDQVCDDYIVDLEIPTGKPLVYELDQALPPCATSICRTELPSRSG